MSLNLKQVLEDEKTFADGIEITINNEKVTLGDLRGLSRAKQNELSEKMAETERRRTEVMDLATKAADLQAQYEKQLAEVKNRPNPSEADFKNDPFWAPVRDALASPVKTVGELQDKLDKLTNAVTNVSKIWAEDRWAAQFDRSKGRLKGDKFKDWTYEKARDYAAQNKILDNFGLPSVERAILELTKEDDLAQKLSEAREAGLKEGLTRGRMGVMPKPTSASGPKHPENSAVSEKGLEGLGDAVADDPELMRMLSELGAVNPEDLVQ